MSASDEIHDVLMAIGRSPRRLSMVDTINAGAGACATVTPLFPERARERACLMFIASLPEPTDANHARELLAMAKGAAKTLIEGE